MRLKIQTPTGKSKTVAISRSQYITLGRDKENDVVLENDSKASGRHARIEVTDARVQIIDLGSTNGVFIDEKKITANEPKALSAHQSARIGLHEVQLIDGRRFSVAKFDFGQLTNLARLLRQRRLRVYGAVALLILSGFVAFSLFLSRYFSDEQGGPIATPQAQETIPRTPIEQPATPTSPPPTSTLESAAAVASPRFIPRGSTD